MKVILGLLLLISATLVQASPAVVMEKPRCDVTLCVPPICPPGHEVVVPDGECCPVCRPCPPLCSTQFCKDYPTAICSNPGPREIPGCTGTCNLAVCSACFHHARHLPPPHPDCPTCKSYTADRECYRRWAKCVGKYHIEEFGEEVNDKLDLLCYSPPCPLRG